MVLAKSHAMEQYPLACSKTISPGNAAFDGRYSVFRPTTAIDCSPLQMSRHFLCGTGVYKVKSYSNCCTTIVVTGHGALHLL